MHICTPPQEPTVKQSATLPQTYAKLYWAWSAEYPSKLGVHPGWLRNEIFFFFGFFLGQHPKHVEVPRLVGESEL